ncbi:MAG: hypothetical protein ACOCQD_01400 [archaeon]
MIFSERLNNIKRDLEKVTKKAEEDLEIEICMIFETGSINDDDEKRVREFLNESYGTYTHKPRKYISIYPLTDSVFGFLKETDYYITNTREGFTHMLHDMMGTTGYREDTCGNVYKRVIVELDSNYIERLSDLKNHGSEITFHLERDILTALSDIKDDYAELSEKILNNLMANTVVTKDYLNGRSFVSPNNYEGAGKYGDLNNRNFTFYNEKFLKLLDLTIVWYINYKIVKQNVLEKDIFCKIDNILRVMDRVRGFDKSYYFKMLLSGDVDIKKDSLMDVMFNSVYLETLNNNPYEKKNIKYKPMYPRKKDKSILHADGTSSNESNLISEAPLVSFEIDSSDMIKFIGECVLLDQDTLIAESIFDIFKKADSKKIIELAREVDQIAVEFEFMYDQYSKSDAMHRAYDCLDRVDKQIRTANSDDLQKALTGIRAKLLDIIKENRNRDIRKQRMTINIEYPKGYGMNA